MLLNALLVYDEALLTANIGVYLFLGVDSSAMNERLDMFSTEKDLENASLYEPDGYVGVVFLDSMSYRLRFPYNQLPLPSDFTESISENELTQMS